MIRPVTNDPAVLFGILMLNYLASWSLMEMQWELKKKITAQQQRWLM